MTYLESIEAEIHAVPAPTGPREISREDQVWLQRVALAKAELMGRLK